MKDFKNILYGDGIHDDYPAIQEMIDSGVCEVSLPAPEKCYLISKTLTLPSEFKLTLPRYAEIKLMDMSNCPMISNKMVEDYAERVEEKYKTIFGGLPYQLWAHVNKYSPEIMTKNIEIEGGIWNFNNMRQLGNPEQTRVLDPYGYSGDGMLFYGVKGLRMSNMTFKDPVHYGATFDRVSYFTIENIVFDYNLGNPYAVNLDGVHFNGNCHYGMIHNLKGTCYDDMVALNADEGTKGPITNITIDGLYAEDCHSAVRLLSANYPVKNVHITNVNGTYYQYCIGITRIYPTADAGDFDGIAITNVYASKAARRTEYNKGDDYAPYVYPLIYVQDGLRVRGLRIVNLHRREYRIACPTVAVDAGTVVEDMVLQNVTVENHTDASFVPLLENHGEIRHLHTDALYNDGKMQ